MSFLLQPLQAGKLHLSNRLVMPPMATAKAEPDGSVSQALIDYYDEKSRGGYISLVIIEHSYIHPGGKASNNQLSIADDSVIEPLKDLADTIHRNGGKAVIQMNHAGSAVKDDVAGVTRVAPSAVEHPRRGYMARELTRDEIREIIRSFATAALRVKKVGFDGAEIHSAHGYLLGQFFSPLTNKRADEYGGDLSGRIRVHLEVIEAVREAVGDDFPVLLRLGVVDFIEGGITIEDSQQAARAFEKAGVDILDISGGMMGYNIPTLSGEGYFAPLSRAIKDVVDIPVILTGGITTVQAAERLLKEGDADLIGVGRAILEDSAWAQKAITTLKEKGG